MSGVRGGVLEGAGAGGARDATALGGVVLDDIDARPGSAASYLRTIIGLYLRPLGGRISSAALVQLVGELDISETRARTAFTRLKQKGLLLADRSSGAGYRLNPAAMPMLERGDRRIFHMRQMTAGDRWCLVSFSIPEAQRDLRHRLRSQLRWFGCGAVSPALWICPAHLTDEVETIIDELGARAFVTLFRTDDPQPGSPLAQAVTQWWDLDALRAEHERFLASAAALARDTDASAFSAYVRLIDSWRLLPYNDPGLSPTLLPPDWPGQRSYESFAALSARWAEPAWAHVTAAAGLPHVTAAAGLPHVSAAAGLPHVSSRDNDPKSGQ